ncbi:uncharacterized protein LOC129293493 [Prosopis cineraria]|uniref:uncharacterized protein LOC129293493 n=1 Tax=Prosopis cineraria TaxID=364024 RepID=UPI00240FED00|nr:uncharacterized protein LOC129293493 [Prosopis cineraria]
MCSRPFPSLKPSSAKQQKRPHHPLLPFTFFPFPLLFLSSNPHPPFFLRDSYHSHRSFGPRSSTPDKRVVLKYMAKKRKSIASSLDEVDRTMYASFCSAANSLSQLYTQAMNHQKLSFQAGERHGLEKLYQWIWRQQEGGSRVAPVDILSYIQNELDYCGEEPSMSPRAPLQHQQSQPLMHVNSAGFPVTPGSSGQTVIAQGLRSENGDNQQKNSVFSNALSSPVRQSLQNYHIGEGGSCPSSLSLGNGNRNSEPGFFQQQSRDSAAFSANDSAMDMHAD